MATFPEDPKPVYPLVVTPVWNTIISQTGTGKEQRLQKSLFAVYDVTVKYYGLSSADAKTLWEFYMARKGAFEAFYIYDLALLAGVSFVHTGMYAGVGDGATDVFDIPGRSTSSQTIYIDGNEQSTPTDYSILTGGGVSGSDRIDFVSAPAEGNIITCDFAGFLRIRARFLHDELPRELFIRNLFNYGIELKGLKPA